jgi:hypothetical protein
VTSSLARAITGLLSLEEPETPLARNDVLSPIDSKVWSSFGAQECRACRVDVFFPFLRLYPMSA